MEFIFIESNIYRELYLAVCFREKYLVNLYTMSEVQTRQPNPLPPER